MQLLRLTRPTPKLTNVRDVETADNFSHTIQREATLRPRSPILNAALRDAFHQ